MINLTLLRPEIAAYLEELARVPSPALELLTPEQARTTMLNNVAKFKTTIYPVEQVKDYTVSLREGDISLRAYTPEIDHVSLPILVYFHGGGWVCGDLETHDNICRLIATNCNCIVVAVDYPLAPEHKFSSIIETCYQALDWVCHYAENLGGDVRRVAVGGDSAGATLAATMTLMAKDRSPDWSIIYQILICPSTNLATLNTESYLAYSDYGLSRDKMMWLRNLYLSNESEASHPYASPLLAEELKDLPPALVVTSEFDVLRDEGDQYAERLKQAGVTTVHHSMTGMIHSGVFWAAASTIIADEIDFVCQQIREHC